MQPALQLEPNKLKMKSVNRTGLKICKLEKKVEHIYKPLYLTDFCCSLVHFHRLNVKATFQG